MKKKNWFRGLSLADDKYIDEARPDKVIRSKRKRVLVSIVAASACFALLLCNLWLFIPYSTNPPDVSMYEDSEYYGIIQKLNALTFERPKYKNNAENIWHGFFKGFLNGGVKAETDGVINAMPDGMGGSLGTSNYKEITDNQVEGIVEADRIKRSDKYIYYLDGEVLRIYSIDKENTKEIGSYDLYDGGTNYYTDQWEFYLSNDCKTATIVTQYYANTTQGNRFVELVSLDV